jgi:GNAT superfamily N-acetyltransferase
VEDMIVDDAYRGKGYGQKMLLELISWAKKEGIDTIELTSNPKRIAANELYKKTGFELHPTNHYLYKF